MFWKMFKWCHAQNKWQLSFSFFKIPWQPVYMMLTDILAFAREIMWRVGYLPWNGFLSMASVETNVCMHSTYTHVYFKHISKQKNCLFAVTTTEMYLQAGLTPKWVGTQSSEDSDWLLTESSWCCTMWYIHCKLRNDLVGQQVKPLCFTPKLY